MPKNQRQVINLHIEPVDAPTVQIVVSDVSRQSERTAEVLFIWSEPVVFQLSTGNPATSVGSVGVVLSDLVKETESRYKATMTLPENAVGTGSILVKACSVKGALAAGPTYPTTARVDYDTRYTQESLAALCQLDFAGSTLAGIENPFAFSGVLETVENGAYQYVVVQVRKALPVLPRAEKLGILPVQQAGAVLYRLNMVTCAWTVLRTYPAVTLAARSFCVKDGRVYWFEGSNYAYLNEGETRDVQSDDAEDKAFKLTRIRGVPHDWKSKIGNIASINNTEAEPTDHGVAFVSAKPSESPHDVHDPYYGVHGGTVSPCIDDGHVKVIAGYGDWSEVTDGEKDTAKIENLQTVRLGTHLSRKVPVFQSNAKTAFDVVQALAARSLSVYGLDAGTFFFEPRLPLHANFQSVSGTQMEYTNLSQALSTVPSAGYVSNGSELIQYDGVNATHLQNIERAQEGTTQGIYSSRDILYFIDHVVPLRPDTIADQIDNITVSDDRDHIYNTINVSYGEETYTLTDAHSVSRYGALPLDISAELHATERDLAKWLAEMYLFRFKDLQNVINLQLNYSPFIKQNDLIFVVCRDRLFIESPAIVVNVNTTIRKDAAFTQVRAVTIPLRK